MKIETHDLVKTYGERTVVNHVNVTVEQGKIVGLLGPNGAGKTTTFYMIVGIIRPDEGQVTVDGAEITDMPIHMRHRFGIGYLPQEASIFRDLTVWDNLMAFLETREDLTPEQRKEKASAEGKREHPWIEDFKCYQNITQFDRKAVVTLIDKVIVYGKDRLEICFKYADEIQEMTEAAQNIREMEEREGRFKCGA